LHLQVPDLGDTLPTKLTTSAVSLGGRGGKTPTVVKEAVIVVDAVGDVAVAVGELVVVAGNVVNVVDDVAKVVNDVIVVVRNVVEVIADVVVRGVCGYQSCRPLNFLVTTKF
jgi:hypothetical protein